MSCSDLQIRNQVIQSNHSWLKCRCWRRDISFLQSGYYLRKVGACSVKHASCKSLIIYVVLSPWKQWRWARVLKVLILTDLLLRYSSKQLNPVCVWFGGVNWDNYIIPPFRYFNRQSIRPDVNGDRRRSQREGCLKSSKNTTKHFKWFDIHTKRQSVHLIYY